MPADPTGFKLHSTLGKGGMGAVYLAEVVDPIHGLEQGERVALKMLRRDRLRSPSAMRRFQQEARAGKALAHPHLARVLATGGLDPETETHPYLVLEYVAGQSARSHLEGAGPMPEALCRHIGLALAAALEALHGVGIVHRDVKPSNVMLTPGNEVKLVDLGVAWMQADADRITASGEFVGSYRYAAPEQLNPRGSAPDPRSDLYALGATLFELVTGCAHRRSLGRHEWSERPFLELMVAGPELRTVDPAAADSLPSHFFRELLRYLLSPEAADRPSSAAEVGALLEEGTGGDWYQDLLESHADHRERPVICVTATTDIVGRDVELREAALALGDLPAGEGGLLVVTGEAGIGKSRLLQAVADELPEIVRVAHVRCTRADPGLGSVAAAIASLVGERIAPRTFERLLPGAPRLARGLSRLAAGERDSSGARGDAAGTTTALTRVLRALAMERPLLLVIEDLHRADRNVRELITSVAPITADCALGIVASARPHLPRDWIADLRTLAVATHLELGRLDQSALMELLAALGAGRAEGYMRAEELCAASAGNPLFLHELARSIDRDGWSASPDTPMPQSIRDLVSGRLASLDDEDRELLQVASCVGSEFTAAVVAQVVQSQHGSAQSAFIPTVRALARIQRSTGLIRSSGSAFMFDHDLLRESLYEELPVELRSWNHGAIAEAIASGTPSAAEADGGDAAAICDHFIRAGRFVEAEPFLESALEHLSHAYEHERALLLLDVVLESEWASSWARRAKFELRRVEVASRAGMDAANEPLLARALKAAQQSGERALEFQALMHIAHARLVRGQLHEMRDYAHQARAVAHETGIADHLAEATLTEGLALLHGGDPGLARRHFEAVLEMDPADVGWHLRYKARGNLAMLPDEPGGLNAKIAMVESCVAEARAAGSEAMIATALNNLAFLYGAQGRRADAIATTREMSEIANRIGSRIHESFALSNLSVLVLDEGLLAEAMRLAREAASLAREIRDEQSLHAAKLLHAEALFWAHDADPALADMQWMSSALLESEHARAVLNARVVGGLGHELEGDLEAARAEFASGLDNHADAELQAQAALGASRVADALGTKAELEQALQQSRVLAGQAGTTWVRVAADVISACAGLSDAPDVVAELLAAETEFPRLHFIDAASRLALATGDARLREPLREALAIVRDGVDETRWARMQEGRFWQRAEEALGVLAKAG